MLLCVVIYAEALSVSLRPSVEYRTEKSGAYNRTNDVSTSIIIVWPRTSYSKTKMKERVGVWCREQSDSFKSPLSTKAVLTCHEAAIATSGGILALTELVHMGGKEFGGARSGDVETETAVKTRLGVRGLERRAVLTSGVGKPAPPGDASSSGQSVGVVVAVAGRHAQ